MQPIGMRALRTGIVLWSILASLSITPTKAPDYPRASFAPLPDIALPDTARVDNRRSLRI